MTENFDNSTSPLLINESPLQVLPRLAVAIGLNEAIVLQQIHYWLRKQSEVKEGKKWVYNTYEDWQKQFPYLKMATIRRTFKSLEKQGLLITGNFNKYSFDKTKWYSIDYEKLDSLSRRCAQIEQTDCSNSTHGAAQNEHTNTIRLPETTTENNDDMSGKPDASSSKSKLSRTDVARKALEYFNQKTGKHLKPTTDNLKQLLARLKAGYSAEDIKKVIVLAAEHWVGKNEYKNYVRPSTIFNQRFDDRLNGNYVWEFKDFDKKSAGIQAKEIAIDYQKIPTKKIDNQTAMKVLEEFEKSKRGQP